MFFLHLRLTAWLLVLVLQVFVQLSVPKQSSRSSTPAQTLVCSCLILCEVELPLQGFSQLFCATKTPQLSHV